MITEADALDLFSTLSFIYRLLDYAVVQVLGTGRLAGITMLAERRHCEVRNLAKTFAQTTSGTGGGSPAGCIPIVGGRFC